MDDFTPAERVRLAYALGSLEVRMSCQTGKWVPKGNLIAVCCVCVQRGLVEAPPPDKRTDGYCDLHFAEWKAELQKRQEGSHMDQTAQREWIFTFGFDHKHPETGERLGSAFVRIRAADSEAAREEMVRRFGLKWAFQYDSEEKAGVAKYHLREVDTP